MYQQLIKYLSNIFGISGDFVENSLGTITVFTLYFTLSSLLKKIVNKHLNEEYRDEVISEILPTVLKLTAFGFLSTIWLTGGASVESTLKLSSSFMEQVVQVIYIILFYLGSKVASEVFAGIKYSHDEGKQYTFRKRIRIIIGVICIILFIKIWINKTENISTYLGLLSAGLAIALQDIIASLAGWAYILMVKPLKVGDRVQIGDISGDIIDTKLLQFCMLETGNWVKSEQATGRILYFPNSFVFKNSIANYDVGFEYIFSEIPITVTFESNWKKARKILEEILENEVKGFKEDAGRQIRKASSKMKLRFAHLDPKIILNVSEFGVCLTLRFLCKVRVRRFIESKIWEKVLDSFSQQADIDFAYPTTRYYLNLKEGKSEAGGPKLV